MTDAAGPSDEHANAVSQFMEICGSDDAVARVFLQESAWNLENAVQEYYLREEINRTEQDERTQNGQPPAAVPVPPPAAAQLQHAHAANSRSVALTNRASGGGFSGWLRWLHHYFVTVPLEYIYSSVTNVIAFLYMLLANPSLPVTNPRDDVRRFLDEVVTPLAGSGQNTSFLNGSYEDAVRRAKRNVQCLLVYLHSPTADSRQFLVSHLLTEPFRALLRQNDCLLWGVGTDTPEGKRIANGLQIISYPALALLTCVPGGRMASILRLSGKNSVFTPLLNNILQSSFDENRPHLMPMLREKYEKNYQDTFSIQELNHQMLRTPKGGTDFQKLSAVGGNRNNNREERERGSLLIREQDNLYAQSLAADRAKREELKRQEDEKKDRERKAREEIERIQQKRQKLADIRSRLRDAIPAQPTAIGGSGGIVCVRIKFPSGQTFTWKFDESASLEELFNVVSTRENCPQDFSLVLAECPSAVLNCAPEWYKEFTESAVLPSTEIISFSQAGFHKSAVVLVRDNEA